MQTSQLLYKIAHTVLIEQLPDHAIFIIVKFYFLAFEKMPHFYIKIGAPNVIRV